MKDRATDIKYDDIVLLAAEICQTPIAIIDLIDGDRQRPLANIGWDHKWDMTLSQYVLQGKEMVIVPDTLEDPRFTDHPLVTEKPYLRFYAGVPLIEKNGTAIGTLAVMDNTARTLDAKQKKMLTALARQVVILLELNRILEETQTLSQTDKLTRVSNRHYFEKEAKRVISFHQKNHTNFFFLLLDLNDFKAINDQYGHSAGDELLTLFAKRIGAHLKQGDIISRFGGDEFVVILQNVSSHNEAFQIIERLINACNQPYDIEGKKILCSANLGIAVYPQGGTSIHNLYLHADFALYIAKKHDQSAVFYTDEVKKEFEQRSSIEEHIVKAFEREEFYCVYQPIIDTSGPKIYGFETLLRWKMGGRDEISPAVFIPLIEKMGLSEILNLYAVNSALKEIKVLEKAISGPTPIKLSINISPKVADIESHFEKLISLIEAARLNKNKIQVAFEITETDFMKSSLIPNEKLKRHNIALVIDDFGVRYSSMRRLTEHQFDTIKIDGCFVQELDKDNGDSAKLVIRAIKSLGDDLEFEIIAEGAETKAQVDVLQELGCHIIQGFYYYKPVPLEEAIRLLTR